MRKFVGSLALAMGSALAFALGSASAMAHHGITAQFDTSTTFEIFGVVTDLEFVNPHAYVYFDVTSPEGEVVPWRCELRAATVLRRSGWNEDMFSPGTEIDVLARRIAAMRRPATWSPSPLPTGLRWNGMDNSLQRIWPATRERAARTACRRTPEHRR